MAIPCKSVDQPGWLELREQLWPHHPSAEHLAEMASFLASPERFAQFIEYDPSGNALGFVEVALRSGYVNGTNSSPVGFLEGIYVVPQARRQGIARILVASRTLGRQRWLQRVRLRCTYRKHSKPCNACRSWLRRDGACRILQEGTALKAACG